MKANLFLLAKWMHRLIGLVSVVACWLLSSMPASAYTSANFSAFPPTLRGSTPPLVMLAMSRDHQLYVKAYTDYSDLDGNGVLDTSYIDTFDYYGYFNSNFCYTYDSANGYFAPVAAATGTNKHLCGTSPAPWSGNFLNWATMTRMDVVRAVLYGGSRISGFDTATSGAAQGVTVLERTFLPRDNHAFVKVYSGTDINQLTPYSPASNKISLCNTSLSSSGAPLIRIAEDGWQQWSSSEVVQCRYRDEGDSGLADQPNTSNRPSGLSSDLNARVKVCVVGIDATGSNPRCKAYTNTSNGDITYKPVGILQQYGDDGRIKFGLLTGSYNKKVNGGVLRKDILPITGNVTSTDNEIDLANGRFINQGASDGGIINTLTRFRIVNYNFSGNYSDCNTYSIPISDFISSSPPSGRECRSWGNPLSEIYLEALRYFAGASGPTSAFNISDSTQVSSLPQLTTWANPLSSSNACANCSMIVISTGLNSFDGDDLGSVSDLPGLSTTTALNAKTDAIGTNESIHGGSYLIGRNGTTNDDVCTAKTVNNLSAAKGVCPEVPSQRGGYDIAGLAYYAFTSDLRTGLSGIQKVNTYAVALSESLPNFEINVNGNKVSFVPTCQANTSGSASLASAGWTDCSLVDVRVEQQTAISGSFLVAWEDSLWGNDYDMDGIARIEYCVGSAGCPATPANSPSTFTSYNWKTGLTADQIQFRVSVPQANAGNALRFGYVISGVQSGSAVTRVTNAPGVSGGNVTVTPANGAQSYLLRQGVSAANPIRRLSTNSGNNAIFVEPVVFTASSLVSAGKLLENPLWYAAKYGNFNDIDGDQLPDSNEWDVRNVFGLTAAEGGGPDGVPDNYFPVRNPANLVTSLQQVLQRISASVASSTAAAVVANSSRGAGAVYQAVYYPQFQKKNAAGQVVDSIDWAGELHALFIDDDGVIREDNGTAGRLEAMTIDYGVEIYYDAVQNLTLVQRYNATPFSALTAVGSPVRFEQLSPIWSVRDNLAALSTAQLGVQRSYGSATSTGRYIFTWIDADKDGLVDTPASNSEVVDFVDTTFPIATSTPGPTASNQHNYRYLGLANANLAADVVNYVRGIEVNGSRSRSIDYDGTGDKVWRLGDIINSSPVVVGAPSGDYDRRYGDSTYLAYRQRYENRRQVVYVGGNDGMLHAINAGRWNPATTTFDQVGSQPLGGELWAYVPQALLPHLQWLRETNYPHVFYVDGSVQAFDVNIFTPDATHPNGWGTIVVAGMRLGGGDFALDTDGDSANDSTMRSAYMIFDVTDPESPPKLLAEISDPALGFTVGSPTVVKSRVPGSGSFTSPSKNEWLLVFGSGPNVLSTATSTQNSSVFAWSFNSNSLVVLNSGVAAGMAEANSFLGSMKETDWDNDYTDDAVYVGTVGGTPSSPTGKLKRLRLGSGGGVMGLAASGTATAGDLYDPARPIFATPSTFLDTSTGDSWVFFGSGRYLVPEDSQSTSQQAYYGIKEPKSGAVLTYGQVTSGVQDVTDVHVSQSGAVLGASGSTLVIDGDTIASFGDLRRKIMEKNGWVRYLSTPTGEGAERNITDSTFFFSSVLFATYQPDADLCSAAGDGRLYAVSIYTGTAAPFGPLGTADPNSDVFPGLTDPALNPAVDLGRTNPSTPDVVGGDKGLASGSHGELIQQDLQGESTPFGRQSWREVEINFGL